MVGDPLLHVSQKNLPKSMSQSKNNQNTESEQDLEPPPKHAQDVLIFTIKTILIAAGVFGIAWILVSVNFS
ncbi:MAG: hypothetical protein ACI9E1_002026 [Cryomorphaceae bacterium]|jgi:hypothetical protein